MTQRTGGGVAPAVGVAVLMVVCCAGPVLLAAGALGVVAGWLLSWWLLLVALAVAGAGVAFALRRHGPGGDRCDPTRTDDDRGLS
jgi:hypothetical protein